MPGKQTEWISAQDGVPIVLRARLHGCVKVIKPTELCGDNFGLVHSRGTRAVEIKLLQSDHINRQLGDDGRNSGLGTLPVHPDTAMNIVSGDAESGSRN